MLASQDSEIRKSLKNSFFHLSELSSDLKESTSVADREYHVIHLIADRIALSKEALKISENAKLFLTEYTNFLKDSYFIIPSDHKSSLSKLKNLILTEYEKLTQETIVDIATSEEIYPIDYHDDPLSIKDFKKNQSTNTDPIPKAQKQDQSTNTEGPSIPDLESKLKLSEQKIKSLESRIAHAESFIEATTKEAEEQTAEMEAILLEYEKEKEEEKPITSPQNPKLQDSGLEISQSINKSPS